MAVVVFSVNSLAVGANVKTADQVSGTYQHVGAGVFTFAAKGSATGLNATVTVGGVALANDLPIPGSGPFGTIDLSANIMASQALPGGRVEATFRETAGVGAKTADAILYWEPITR